MAYRLFEGTGHAALYAKFRPVTPDEVIAKMVTFLKEKCSSPLQHALDAGCGPGQSTKSLSSYFQKVTGIDVSEAQIAEAEKNNTLPNVEYKACPVEKIPLADGSLQLVTACQSVHWFHLPDFYQEVNRLLVPSGVLAVYAYDLPMPVHSNESLTKNAQKIVKEFYDNMSPYTAPQRAFVDNRYKDIELPYEDNVRMDVTTYSQCLLSDYCGYFETWSFFQKLRKENPEKAEHLINDICDRLKEALEAPSFETPLTLHVEYFILMGRKNS